VYRTVYILFVKYGKRESEKKQPDKVYNKKNVSLQNQYYVTREETKQHDDETVVAAAAAAAAATSATYHENQQTVSSTSTIYAQRPRLNCGENSHVRPKLPIPPRRTRPNLIDARSLSAWTARYVATAGDSIICPEQLSRLRLTAAHQHTFTDSHEAIAKTLYTRACLTCH
jgi:hypothetical protein